MEGFTMRFLMQASAVVCAALIGTAAVPADDKKPFTDADFVAKAASGGLHEVELGKLAQTNAQDAEVKKFAERMVTDHTKANQELMAAAKAANIPVPTGLAPDDQKEVDRFRALKGADFDRQYITHMVKDHEKDLDLFGRASKEAKDPGLKAFATRTIPVIQEHQKLAKQINDRINKK
jgi:putative membrane protein